MISLDTLDQIDDIATDIAVLDSAKERRQAINMALIKYAEKLEEVRQQTIFSEEIEKQFQIRVEQDLGKLSMLITFVNQEMGNTVEWTGDHWQWKK